MTPTSCDPLGRFAIITFRDDIHALAVQRALAESDTQCLIVEADDIAGSDGLVWSSLADFPGTLPTRDGGRVEVATLDVIWWRRTPRRQRYGPEVAEGTQRVIDNDCYTSILGILLTDFSGTWVNEPAASEAAENKLLQLRVAQEVGFRVPRTIVTQDPVLAREFCAALRNQVVVKAVRGFPGGILTTHLTMANLESDADVRVSPTMFQEYIPGNTHYRVHCFGDQIHIIEIRSDLLDWRKRLDVPFRPVEGMPGLSNLARAVLARLHLRMGILDLKVDARDGSPIWLEINPQGQYLFAEGLSGVPLTESLAEFFRMEALAARQRPAWRPRRSDAESP